MSDFEELASDEPPVIDPYEVLGLERTATPDQVKAAYRKTALRCHPDKVSEDKKAEAHVQFQNVAFAYAVLSDPARRQRYDATGSTAESVVDADGFSWSDFYRAAFADAVSGSAIDEFAKTYRESDEERADVLAAYTRAKGNMDGVFESVMLSRVVEDDARFREIIDAAIAAGDVRNFPAYAKETSQTRATRAAAARRESREAEEYAKELGVHDKLFGKGAGGKGKDKGGKGGRSRGNKKGQEKDDQAGLAALIQKRQQDRAATFLDDLAAKYGATEPKGKGKGRGKKGKKRPADDDDEADGDDGEPSEEAFQAAAARLKNNQSQPQPRKKRARRGPYTATTKTPTDHSRLPRFLLVQEVAYIPSHAMTDATPPLIYYPQYCFHLSPTLNKWCPFRVSDVQALTWREEFRGQNVYFYLNHPIRWVRVAGAVVACDEYYGRLVYTVDDGSGMTIECSMKREIPKKQDKNGSVAAAAGTATGAADAPPDTPAVPGVGDVVGIKGELRSFRGFPQVQVLKIVRLRSTEEEVRFWAKVQAFATDVVARPWELDRRVVRKCRKEAEKGETKGWRERKMAGEVRAGEERAEREREEEEREERERTERGETADSRGKRQKQDTSRDTQDTGREKGRAGLPSPPRRPPPRWTLGSSTGGTGGIGNTESTESTEQDEATARSRAAPSPKRPPPPRWYLGS